MNNTRFPRIPEWDNTRFPRIPEWDGTGLNETFSGTFSETFSGTFSETFSGTFSETFSEAMFTQLYETTLSELVNSIDRGMVIPPIDEEKDITLNDPYLERLGIE